jgi:hypothetical protein
MSFRISSKVSQTIPMNVPQNVVNNGNIDITGYYKVDGVPVNNQFYPALSTATAEKALNTWTPQLGYPGFNPNRSAWSPELGLFGITVAQGTGGRVITSPNGVNWTNQRTGVDLSLCNNVSGNIVSCLSTSGVVPGMNIGLVSGAGTVPANTTVSGIIDISTFSTNNTITGLTNSVLNTDFQYFGITWCPDLSGTGYFLASRSNGIATSTQQIITSTNGVNWTARTTPTGFNDPHMFSYSPQLKRVICGRGGGSAFDPAFIYSNDGISWTTVSNPVPENFYFESAWSDQLGLFCSVAFNGTSNKKVILSRDGINWTPVDISANVSNEYSVVRWSPELGIFCALIRNTTPNVMISSDGFNWQFYSTPSSINYRNLIWSPQLRVFVAVSESGTNRLAYSYDGKTWFEKNLTSVINSALRGISWSPELGIFCINGQTGTPVVITSALSGSPPTSFNVFDSSFNNINELGLWNFQSFGRGVPVFKNTSFTVANGENWIVCTATLTITLPTGTNYIGEELMIKNVGANQVLSNAVNIRQADNTVSNVILSAVAKNWVTLVYNGVNWVKMEGNNL